MNYTILKKHDQVSEYVEQVITIADANRKSLGFLPKSAYEYMALKNRLWIAVNNSKEIVGYLMFGGTKTELNVSQIYTDQSVRGSGVGYNLIEDLKIYAKATNCKYIRARVASDLPANLFWDRMGFTIIRQIPGGATTSRTLNVRWYSLDDNDLFGGLCEGSGKVVPNEPVLSRPVYALDLNLLFDVAEARADYENVTKIMQIGFQGKFSIRVTPEFAKEFERQSPNVYDDVVSRWAGIFPELKTNSDISHIIEPLRGIVFPGRSLGRKSAQNDESDLRHLAYCISAKVNGFITRDKALLQAYDEIRDKYGILILAPHELVPDNESLDTYSQSNSDFSVNLCSSIPEIEEFLKAFSAPQIVTDHLNKNDLSEHAIGIYEARLDGKLFGAYFSRSPSRATENAMAALYIDENCSAALAAIDHFVESSLRHKSKFIYRLDLYIGQGQELTEQTLLKKGFLKLDDHFVKVICNSFIDAMNWRRFVKDLERLLGFSIPDKIPSKHDLTHTGVSIKDTNKTDQIFSRFDFETIMGPRFILYSGRNCILVSIRENYANGLIGNDSGQVSLLPSYDKSLLLEKAYFRASSRSSIFRRGEIIAFYVSGRIKELIGFARITYSDVITIDEAMIRLQRQGVLSSQELENIVDKKGRIHVFTFDNFLKFDRNVSFKTAKELGLISDANLVAPEKISYSQLKTLIREAFSE